MEKTVDEQKQFEGDSPPDESTIDIILNFHKLARSEAQRIQKLSGKLLEDIAKSDVNAHLILERSLSQQEWSELRLQALCLCISIQDLRLTVQEKVTGKSPRPKPPMTKEEEAK